MRRFTSFTKFSETFLFNLKMGKEPWKVLFSKLRKAYFSFPLLYNVVLLLLLIVMKELSFNYLQLLLYFNYHSSA